MLHKKKGKTLLVIFYVEKIHPIMPIYPPLTLDFIAFYNFSKREINSRFLFLVFKTNPQNMPHS